MPKRMIISVSAATLFGTLGVGALWWYTDLKGRLAGDPRGDNGRPAPVGGIGHPANVDLQDRDDGRPTKMPWLVGLSLEDVIAKLGEPRRKLEYTMADSPGGEFRIELFNTYPPNDRTAMKAKILELQWDRPGYHLCVWLHEVNGRWKALDTCRWPNIVAF